MNPVQRLYRADDRRKTRLHDQRGNRIDAAGLLYAPRVFVEAVLRSIIEYRPVQPWLSYRAAAEIARLLDKSSRVLEFGAGMSTPWFAARCGLVVSLESDPAWFKRVRNMLQRRGLDNAQVLLRSVEDYPNLGDFDTASFDFVLVDGPRRSACVSAALPKLKQGGYLYLDNTDDPSDPGAEEILLAAVSERHGQARYFTDFEPGQMAGVQGLLAHL